MKLDRILPSLTIFKDEKLIQDLYNVKKPSAYLPLELNQRAPSFEEREVRFVLTYPDLYEVGSSHIGGKILYHVLNNLTDFATELTFPVPTCRN